MTVLLLNFEFLKEPIISMFVILFFGFLVAFVTGIISRIIIQRSLGIENYRRIIREIREFDAEFLKAYRSNDKAKIEKLSVKKPYIDKMRSKTFRISFLNSFILLPFFIIIYSWLFSIYGNINVVYFPLFNIHLSFFWWYLISVFFANLITSRILNIYI